MFNPHYEDMKFMTEDEFLNKFPEFVCPATGGRLVYCVKRQSFISPIAKLAYPIKNKIPIMVAEEANPLSDEDVEEILKNSV